MFKSTTLISNTPVITATQIKFTGLNISVGDFTNVTISLRLTVKSNTNAGSPTGVNADGNDFGFQVASTDLTASVKGSQFTGFTTINSTDAKNVYAVIATKLTLIQQPTDNITNNSFSPVVSVQAGDAGGNRDIGLSGNVTITASGATLTGSPVNAALASGLATFTGAADLKFSTAGNPVTLTAAKTGVTSIVSNSFAITVPGLAVYRTKASGSWAQVSPVVWEMSTNNGASWSDVTSTGLIPSYLSSYINVLAGHAVTVLSDITIDETTVAAGGQVTINPGIAITLNNGAANPDLDVKGTVLNAGGTAVKQGQISFNTGATVIFRNGSLYKHTDIYASVPAEGSTTWDANSTLEFTGSYSTAPNISAAETYGNVIWNSAGQSGTVNLNGALKNIAGYFDLKSTNGQYLQLASATGATVNVTGDFIIEGGLLQFSDNTGSSANGDHILNLNGAYNQSGGSFEGYTDATRNLAVNFNGTGALFTKTAGTFNTAQININVGAGADVTLNSSMALSAGRSLTVNGTFVTGTQQVTGGGSVTVNNVLITANSGGLTGNSSAAIATGVTLNTLGGSSLIKYNSSAAQLISGRADYNKVTVTGNSTKTMDGDVAISDSLFINDGDISINGHTLVLNGTIDGGGDLTGSSTSNLTVGGTAGNNVGTLSFTVGNELLGILKMNRTGTGAKALLGSDVIVDNLNLTSGVIATDVYLLTVTDGSGIANYSAASYVATCDINGNTIDTALTDAGFRIDNVGGSTDTYFPVGPNFNSYNRAMINNAGGPDYFTVIMSLGDIGNTPKPVVERIWTIRDGNPGTNNADLRLYFTKRDWAGTVQDEIEPGFDYGDVRLAAKPGIGFSNYSSGADNRDYTNGGYPYGSEIYAEYTRANNGGNGIQIFQRFAALNLSTYILPVNIIKFNACVVNGKVEVRWHTATEVNMAHYEVEKSADGIKFSRQCEIAAHGNSGPATAYQWLDPYPLQGKSFYRIRAVDKDGSDSYTGIISIKINAGKQHISIHPNPVINKLLNLRLGNIEKGIYTLEAVNAAGQIVFIKSIEHPGGSSLQKIALPAALVKGMYFISIRKEGFSFKTLLLVE